MRFDQPSVDQIIAAKAQQRRAMFIFLASFVLLIVAAGLLLLATRTDVIPIWLLNALVAALFLAWLGFILFRIKPTVSILSSVITDEAYQRKTIDTHQRNARYWLLYLLVYILGMGFLFSHVILKNSSVPPILVPFGFAFAIVVLLGVLGVAYGFGLFSLEYDLAGNDELSRAQRAQATQLGYVFTVMGFCATLIAAITRPQLGIALLPSAIATAVAVPGLYLLFLEWRAGPSDD
jgi:hypothetical protein